MSHVGLQTHVQIVLRSVAPLLHIFKSSAHSCVKDPLRKCNKVATHFALLVDLGQSLSKMFGSIYDPVHLKCLTNKL